MRRTGCHTERPARHPIRGFAATMAIVFAASSAAAASQSVYVDNRYQPSRIAITQGGDYRHTSVHGVTWTEWNQSVATGKGTYTFQFCTPETGHCEDAAFYDTPALVKLSDIVTCKGRASYTRLEVTPDSTEPDTLYKPFQVNVGACPATRPVRHRPPRN